MLVYSLRIHWDDDSQSACLTGEEAESLLSWELKKWLATFDGKMLKAIFTQENDNETSVGVNEMMTNSGLFTAQLKAAFSASDTVPMNIESIFTDTGEDEYGGKTQRRSTFWEINPVFKSWPLYYVGLFVEDRLYGGPEEGGWWYSSYTPCGATIHMNNIRMPPQLFVDLKEAMAYRDKMEKAIESELAGERSSSKMEWVALIQEGPMPGRYEPERKPKYE